MTSSLKVPSTLAATLAPAIFDALVEKLAPPPELRAKARVEFEIEAQGEGTFTITVDGGRMTAKKGFAKDPLVACLIPKGGWPLIERELQAVVDGLPPALQSKVDAFLRPKPGDLDAVVTALSKLSDACVKLDVKGAGTYAVARGPVDEATRVLTVALDAADIDRVLAGAPPTSIKVATSGDRGLLTSVLAALGPVVNVLR